MFNGVEWIPVQGTAQDLSRAEEMSALALYNLFLHSPDAESGRLNRFGEDRDADTEGGQGGSRHHSNDDEYEDVPHSQDNSEESACESDWDSEEDNSQQGNLPDERGGRTNTQPNSSLSHHSTDKCLCHHASSSESECKSEGVEEGKIGTTQENVTEESPPENKSSSKGDADDEDAGEESLQMSPLTLQA